MRIDPLALFVLCALPCAAADPPKPAVSPYTWREDFRGGSLAQFASYPPVQDIGYDPSLSPSTEFNPPNGRALMRVVKPTRAGPERFGFIRALDLLTSATGTLSFTWRLDFARPEDQIEVGIAASDGKRYASAIPIQAGEGWRTVRIPLLQLLDEAGRGAPPMTGIEALYLVANLKHASPDVTYRFLLGNLQLSAARALRFELRSPRSVSIAHWPELFGTAAWEAGRPIAVEAVAPLPLSQAQCALQDQDGRTLDTQSLSGRGQIWSGNVALNRAPPGILTLILSGTSADGKRISTSIRLLRRPPGALAHPRLFFGPADRARLIARTEDPTYAPIWRSLRERARSSRSRRDLSRASAIFALLDPDYLLPTLPAYFDIVTPAGESVELNALDAYLTGDPESYASAKATLLAIAGWNTWAPPWFRAHGQQTYYPAGQLAAKAAFAYDLLYDRLTPDERSLVRRSLREYGIARAYREYVEDNRLLANTSNWLGHTVGGALLAASAIWDDEADAELPLYANGLLRKFEDHLAASYLADGSYGEGISYQEFDLETTSLALTAVERVFGIDYWDRSHVKDSLWYPLSTLAQPAGGSLDMGDTHPPSGYSGAAVVARSGNPVFAWFYNRFPHTSLLDFLFAPSTASASPPPAPGSRYFAGKGNVIFRTGWTEDAAILLFRAGPNFNHNHADQGSFLLRAFGENLAVEGGYADYYRDPHYDSYFKQAIGHNVVLVDQDPASQEIADTLRFPALSRYPRIQDVLLGPSVGIMASDLRQVYRGRLRSYERSILMVGSDYLVVSDDLVANRTPARFDWLLHLPDLARVKTEGETGWYAGPKAALAVRALLPSGASWSVETGPIPYSVFNPSAPAAPPPNPAILELGAPHPAPQTRFLVLLAPARTEAGARAFVSAVRPIRQAGWAGFETRGSPENHGNPGNPEDREDLVLFRQGAPGQETPYADWSTDAAVCLSRRALGRDALLAARSVTMLKRSGRVLFASDRPVTFAADYHPDRVELTVNAPEPAKASIARPDGSLAGLSLPAGQHSFTLRW